MQGMWSNPKEFEVVSILAELHEGREINVNQMHDVEFNEQEEHSDDDIYAHAEMSLVIYTPPQLGLEKTSSPKYFFDGKTVFKILFDKMMHFKELVAVEVSSIDKLEGTCQENDNNIVECLICMITKNSCGL